MNVLVVEPLKAPYEKEIDPGLESLQHEVGGWIEAMGLDEDACIICNEEGKLNGLELNRSIKDDRGRISDIIAGTFLVVGSGEENFDSLTPKQMEKYKKRFRYPETFMRFGGELVAIPIKPHNRPAGEKHKTEPERYFNMTKELHAIGNNIHQISARANATGFFMAKELRENMDALFDAIDRIEAGVLEPDQRNGND